MLDIKFLRSNPDVVKQNIKNKFQDEKLPLVDEVIELDKRNREIKQEVEALRAEKNKASKEIGAMMAQKKLEEAEALKKKVAESNGRINELSEEEKEDLFERIEQGDLLAREHYIKGNLRLVLSIIQRFSGSNENADDLFQVGCIGLMKAIDNFDRNLNVKFSTYAVPMIIGEIRRYLRDDGMLKVSRNLKENCARIYSAREALEKELGREPILEEVAKATELSVDEVVMSMESGAEVESLHKIIYQGDGNDISLMDRLQEKENGQDAALNRIFLDEILKKLDARERQLIGMRYFKDMTQTEIAAEMGISQVQVSRMEKRILKELKKQV